ncbi:MAG TPA: DUF1810 domain-containing protein [Rhizomicrobium sp.]|jgi:uncharacterized protein (DUF1810 family)|nr:DUF1810 domain-containing protein [Rhizomicrobium sp.]
MDDPFNLARFVKAQDPVYGRVVQELRAGRKQTHWMWFIFPQAAGLGSSFMAQRFAISGPEEARAYLAHPLLGGRLRECTGLVLEVEERTIHEIFGSPDDVKFRSCMTLFGEIESDARFKSSLEKFFGGAPDEMTLQLLR